MEGRGKVMAFDVAAELKSEIAKEDDKDRRTLLMLLLGVLEANMEGLAAIARKIDNLLSDERELRATVLNSHSENHDTHHDFVAVLYQNRESTAEERRWVRERMGSECAIGCEWAAQKKREEEDTQKNAVEEARADKRAARDAVIRLIVTAALSSAATLAGLLWAIR